MVIQMKQRRRKPTPNLPATNLDDRALRAIRGGDDSGESPARNGRNGRDHWEGG